MSELRINEDSTARADDFIRVGTLEELKTAGMIVIRGARYPLLVVHDGGKVFALDNRCPHLGFPLHRGSVEDGMLTCHWHHARFDLASGGTFDLWADDVPTAAVEVRDDGPGFAPEILAKLGEPYVTSRPGAEGSRTGHIGMGLGFFIAKTLLERTGAVVTFQNSRPHGAVVSARWRRGRIEVTSN